MLAKLSPCLWYTDKAEEAAAFYASVLPNYKMVKLDMAGLKKAHEGQ